MRIILPLMTATLTAVLLAGCGEKSTTTTTQVQSTNPADIDNPLVNAKRTADKTIDTAALNKAIELFNVQEGRFPKTLEELTPKYVSVLPTPPLGYKLSYDATKGEVSVVRE
jgi:ABC-type oligopeptide transport system substrate-binding subunit